MDSAIEPMVEVRPPRRKRIGKMIAWLVGLALFWLVLQLLGVDVRDWLDHLWDQIKDIWHANPAYIIGALILPDRPDDLRRALVLRHPQAPPTPGRSSSGRSSPPTPSAWR